MWVSISDSIEPLWNVWHLHFEKTSWKKKIQLNVRQYVTENDKSEEVEASLAEVAVDS